MPKVNRAGKSRAKAAASTNKSSMLSSSAAITETKNNPTTTTNQNSTNSNIQQGPDTSHNNLSRGQRKRLLKREQYLKREKMILSTLKLQRSEEQKGRLDGLDAIKEALVDTIQKSREKSSKNHNTDAQDSSSLITEKPESAKSNKSKMDIAQKELTHLNLVLQHPSFVSNPFATMQEHLKNTLSEKAEQLESVAKEERIQEAKRAEERKEARKERIRDAKYMKGRKKRR
mmetsp:Transcript_12155/g.22766  ORF Transcript_12155/g.22766 Transcript_12155/m.22766 type:complete len:230 (-) Transcript_12155:223-912(-)|eukprot:CAMPEP_0176494560 /NCGR_PEP_ID=MMETSP0200_2-20121128/10173_1 /TAXON_ID=947934 /ORGANISM="Chaetoceros sp., Strain GSL56" /LENGTH=229 /DNA_ID=CAMNT_0017892349 /DNA_START=88 /DNA_END=777 /DNA_ORIENTATION=+